MAVSEGRRKALEKEAARNQRGIFFNMKNLKIEVFRKLPYKTEDEPLGFRIGLHFPTQGRPCVCPDITYGKKCPVCAVLGKLAQMEDEEANALVNNLKPTIRFAMKIITRTDPEKVQIAEFPKSVYDEVMTANNDEGEDIDNPLTGRDFRVKKTGSGFQTRYSTAVKDSCKLAESKTLRNDLIKQSEEIDMESIYQINMEDLNSIVEESIPTEILKDIGFISEDTDSDEDEDEDEDKEKPAKKGKKSKDEDLDDEDIEEDSDEDEDEDELLDEDEEKPAKKGKAPISRSKEKQPKRKPEKRMASQSKASGKRRMKKR